MLTLTLNDQQWERLHALFVATRYGQDDDVAAEIFRVVHGDTLEDFQGAIDRQTLITCLSIGIPEGSTQPAPYVEIWIASQKGHHEPLFTAHASQIFDTPDDFADAVELGNP